MTEIVNAIYENGILRPLEPLTLQEHQMVRIQLLPETEAEILQQAIAALVDAGVLSPPPGYPTVEPVSETEREQAANELGQAARKPVSAIIIEERGL
jgi:predicted DNA-binding antitoxin AbrB/MazE fold protein